MITDSLGLVLVHAAQCLNVQDDRRNGEVLGSEAVMKATPKMIS
jgi:hypothetical protein